MPSLPGLVPNGMQLSTDGSALYMRQNRAQSDIWLMRVEAD